MINTLTGKRHGEGELESKLFRARTDIPSQGIMEPPPFIQRLYESSGLEDIIKTNITHNYGNKCYIKTTNYEEWMKENGVKLREGRDISDLYGLKEIIDFHDILTCEDEDEGLSLILI